MRLKRKNKAESEISTASMPDIVFLLLFFFMVSATIKPKENLMNIKPPEANALTKVQKKFLIKELHVGYPKDERFGTSPRISSEDNFLEITDIGRWVEMQKSSLEEMYRDQMIVLIKADEKVNMGIINDLQQELRKYNARKILYRTLEE